MTTKFEKYQGLGNDFIIVNNLESDVLKFSSSDAMRICDRHFGIGGDGLIFVLPGIHGCDYTMRIYNSDGSEPQMCGNGIRCMAMYIHRSLSEHGGMSGTVYRIWTNAGVIVATINVSRGTVIVNMGKPILRRELIPASLGEGSQEHESYSSAAIDADISGSVGANGSSYHYKITAVSMGNPHGVRSKYSFIDDLITQPLPCSYLVLPQIFHFYCICTRSFLLTVWNRWTLHSKVLVLLLKEMLLFSRKRQTLSLSRSLTLFQQYMYFPCSALHFLP
jgi:diaminopimelate epimerase